MIHRNHAKFANLNRALVACVVVPLAAHSAFAQHWTRQPSGTQASLRGASAVNSRIVWASGTGGTYLTTTDGSHWTAAVVPGAEQLDFRGVHAFDARTAILMSAGEGAKSRVYRSRDAGAHWNLSLTNPDAKGFFDCIAFWDAQHGILAGDPVGGKFVIFTTADGGEHWIRGQGPAALPNEGAFAASNSCLVVRGSREAWFATGGVGGARVFHSVDAGKSWASATTPIRNDGTAAGIFSIAFADTMHGVAVGGDYEKPGDAAHNVAITTDGGRTWVEPSGPHPAGYRSAVSYIAALKLWIAAGPSGSDVSSDNGKSWRPIGREAINALNFAGVTGWAVGPAGAVFRFLADANRR